MRRFSRGVLMMGAMLLPVAAEFVAPAEGPVPFRRDKLPVDADTMAALARQVMVLARTSAEAAEAKRAVAQMTALALALDPENREAGELIEAMKAKTPPPGDAREEVERARNRAWQTLSWLEMPEAGADGQALAACLGDVLVVADPKHPKSRERREEGEKGAWKQWVAEESAFRPKDPQPGPEMEPEEQPEPEEDPVETKLVLQELSSPMPIWYYDPTDKLTKLGMVPVKMKASVPDAGEGEGDGSDAEGRRARFRVDVPGEGMTERFSRSMRAVEKAMTDRHGSLPEGLQIGLDLGKVDYSLSRNGYALSGTTALLMDGAFSGKVPTATVLAVVGEEGELELPPRFWQTLRAVSAQPTGCRLILPDEAADFLTALVVMDDAAFFMKNEVLLAGSVEEMCDFASHSPEPEVADGLKRFEEVRNVGQGKALGSFVAHPATQQRLRELAGVMPEHASARMLALQGSGSRPRFLQRPILAREIRSALGPVAYLVEPAAQGLDPERLESAHKESREQLDKLTGYIDIRDRDLLKAATDVADSLRPLARLLPKRDSEDPSGIHRKQREAQRSAQSEYLRVLAELTQVAGDVEDFPKLRPPPAE
jgi:hypothetical protein